ncbi:2-dehydropantoate 2-reductase [Corynebacterium sp. L4756]|uniref:2-dehydropantoate 2-reductase n=1 Tax=unclassified Corynebacterium TaxID=2624378 RepID=UPI00374D694B
MKIVFIGAGAIGGYYGGQLAKAGHDITYVVREETRKVIDAEGLTLINPEGTETITNISTVASLDEVEHADVVISAIKIFGEPSLPEKLPAGAVFMTTENSVEYPMLAQEKYGSENLIPAVARAFIHREGPATAHHMGGVLALSFGSVDPVTEPVVQALKEALDQTPITAKVHPAILHDVWMKAMMVTCFGVLGAVMEQPIDILRTQYRESLRALMAEAADTARAAGIELKEDAVDKVMHFTDQQPEGATASMQRDILEGLPSELDSQVGGIVRVAQRSNTTAPLHQLVWETLRVKSEKLRGA